MRPGLVQCSYTTWHTIIHHDIHYDTEQHFLLMQMTRHDWRRYHDIHYNISLITFMTSLTPWHLLNHGIDYTMTSIKPWHRLHRGIHNHMMSQFELLSFFSQFSFSFVPIWVFELCHNLSFWVLSQFEFLSFVTIWVFEFCHDLSFWVLSTFGFLSFVTFRFFIFILSQFLFFSFVTIWVFKFCHNLCFWFLSLFEFWVLSH